MLKQAVRHGRRKASKVDVNEGVIVTGNWSSCPGDLLKKVTLSLNCVIAEKTAGAWFTSCHRCPGALPSLYLMLVLGYSDPGLRIPARQTRNSQTM